MATEKVTWSRDWICLNCSSLDVRPIAEAVYARTCRVDFDAPGFCLLSVGRDMASVAFRQLMVDIKREMAVIHESVTGNTLAYLSADRFDQQETTRPHLDGGPDECLLMLGYEPSEIDSELEVFDYARCAFDFRLSPKEFMAEYNPMFESGYEVLRPYATRLSWFSPADYQIVCINNSSAPYSETEAAWQGVLHTATILTPDESKRRVVDSTMIAPVPAGTPDTVDEKTLNEFVRSSAVRRRSYDKPYLDDDT